MLSSFLFFFFQAEDGIRDHCVTGVQTCALPISLGVAFLALDGPLHNLSDFYLFSAHMAQHLVLTLLFPPLLLYGTPPWVARPILKSAWVTALARAVTRPVPAAALFTAPIVLWHIPRFYEAALRHHN